MPTLASIIELPHPEAEERSTIATETLARLDRLVAASLLAGGFAHEVAGPLGAVLAAEEALERRVRALRARAALPPEELDELDEDLALARTGAGLITDLVRDIQLFLRAEAERRPSFVDVREAVERALRLARPRLHSVARVEVELRAAPRVAARGNRIVQIVLSLLLDALDALAARPRADNRVTVRVDAAAGRGIVEISDNGPGVPRDPDARGTDLGLSICLELVRRMGGELTVSTLPGAGTTFLLSLPLA
jgi:two-component system NtrC family sensor kinase